MRLSTFFAATLPEAMAKVREALGPKAVVLSWRNTRGGVEISASVQAEYVAPPPARQPIKAKREDLLANHFSPNDFLPTEPRVPIVAKPQSRGLAALVGRQTSAAPNDSTTPKALPFPKTRVGGEGLEWGAPLLSASAQTKSFSQPPPIPHPLPHQGGRGEAHPSKHFAPMTDASRLTTFLTRAGLTDDQAQSFATSSTQELRRALSDAISKALVFDPIAAIPSKPLILVGPPGSGKSTCAAKLAARTIASGHEVLLISADSERCGGADQLAALAKRLGARFEAVRTLADLYDLVSEARQRGIVVFVDAPSACPAQPADMRATARMIDETRLEAVLCLPADLRPDDMEELAVAYQGLGVKRAIATRLDLTTRRASVLHALKIAKIAFAQVSATPYISGGVAIASAARIANLLLEPFEDALIEDAA